MKPIIQMIFGFSTLIITLVFLFLMATSELNNQDLTFAAYFGFFATLSAILFFVLTPYFAITIILINN